MMTVLREIPVQPTANAHRNVMIVWMVVAGLAGLLALNGCGHAHGVEHPNAAAEGGGAASGKPANTKPPTDRPERVTPSEAAAAGIPTHTAPPSDAPPRDATDVPLATSRAGLLEAGAAKKIQQRLVALGFLDDKKQSGAIDDPTGAALRKFQQSRDIAATGTPDAETVRKLDLDPKEIFRAAP